MTWKDITLEKYYKIQDVLAAPDEYTTLNLIDIIYDIDIENLPVSELGKYTLEFLEKEPEKTTAVDDYYELNGIKYRSNLDLTVVNAAQFIDFQTYMKEDHPKFEKLLSVFFIPEGHKYNDGGYSVIQALKDLLGLDMQTVYSASFFFGKQLTVFVRIFQYYLTREIKKMKIDKTKKKELLKKMKETDLSVLVDLDLNLINLV